ncbi:MAG: hypothetical protein ACI9D5_000220 [Candidatus Endobugula sp.]|jgi:hypothetical protein
MALKSNTKKMTKLIPYSFLLIMLTTANIAHAWGPLGHRVVCDIAWRSSSAVIKKRLSSAAKRMAYRTFAESCVWADHIKSQTQYDYLKPLHYMNLSKTATTAASADCLSQQSPQCVVSAIEHFSLQLGNTALPQRDRDKALLLVGHFVADVHQPLHVSYRDDRGGTRRKVLFAGKSVSLHRLWDSELLYCRKLSGKKPSWRLLGSYLFTQQGLHQHKDFYQQRDKPASSEEMSVVAWADESFAITRQLYASLKSKRLPANYCAQYYPIAMQRLQLAGQRLAALLTVALVDCRTQAKSTATAKNRCISPIISRHLKGTNFAK